MKKILKITAIVIISLVVLLEVVPLAFKSKVNEVVKTEVNNMLSAKVNFDNLGISLLRHFPHASITLSGLTITGVDKFEGDTLASIDKIELVVNLASLFSSDGYELTRLIVNQPMLMAHKLDDGAVNWDIMPVESESTENKVETQTTDANEIKADSESTKEIQAKSKDVKEVPAPTTTPKGETSSFKLQVKEVRVNNGALSYVDDSSKMKAAVGDLDLRLSGDLAADKTTLYILLSVGDLNLISGNISMLKDVTMKLDAAIEADLVNNRFTLKDNMLSINAIKLSVDGWAQMNQDQSIEMDLKANTSDVEFRDILSMIPAFYTKDFKDLSASGQLMFDAWVRGVYKGESTPSFDMSLKVLDGAFGYAALPAKVDNINVLASVKSAGGSMDNIIVDLEELSLALAGNTLNVSFSARNLMSDINFDGKAVGSINLGAVKDVYPLDDSVALSGVVTANLGVAGRMSDIEAERFDKIRATGDFKISDMAVKLAGLPAVAINQAAAKITPAQMSLDKFDLKVGESDIQASGALKNYLPFLMKGDVLSGNLAVNSKLLNLNEIMSVVPAESADVEEPVNEEPAEVTDEMFRLPENMNLGLNVSLDKILFQNMILENVKGQVTLKGGELKLNKLNMNAFDGKLTTTGSFSTAQEQPFVALNLDFSNVSFATTFAQMDMIRKMVPLFKSAGGRYSLGMSLNTSLDGEFTPIYSTLYASGKLSTADVKLQNIKVLNVMAEVLKSEKLKNIEAKNVNIDFEIKEGKLYTSPFKVSMGNIALNLSGATSIDGTIDYTGQVELPQGTSSLLSKVGVNIGGTFTSPKVSVSVKDVVKETAKGLLENKLGKVLGTTVKSDSDASGAADNSNNISDETRLAAEKMIEAAKAQRDSMVNKANSKLAKLAAQKAGDALVKKATQNAEKLLQQAESK